MKKKHGKGRLLSAVMSAMLLTAEIAGVSGIAFGAKPMSAQADDGEPEIQLGTAGIDDDEWIAYGTIAENVDWDWGTTIYRVLDADHDNSGETRVTGKSGAIFVLSEGLWGTGNDFDGVIFDYNSREWQGSNAQGWCTDFYNANLGDCEQNALRAITKKDEGFAEDIDGKAVYDNYLASEDNILDGDQVFFLSIQEVMNYLAADAEHKGDRIAYKGKTDGDLSTTTGRWWLRSPSALGVRFVALVYGGGIVNVTDVNDDQAAARPAFNIEKDAVLFSMAGSVDKNSDDYSSSTPAEVGTKNDIGTQADPWKLTLLDSNMTVTPGVSSGFADNDHKILLNDCTSTGDSDRISVMITDKEWAEGNANGASMLYYGKLGEDKTFTIPAELNLDDWGTAYHIYLIAEKTNTGYASDYASLPTEVRAIGMTPAEPERPSNSSSSSSKSHKAHVHEYEWVTISEPTPYADGEYAYKCKGCGHIADTATGDYTAALMTAMTAAIKAAPENGTVKMDCGYYVSLNSVVAAAHDARPDVTTIFTFIYRGDTYEITIPAGVTLVPALNEEGWAGFMHIKNIEGVTIVKK